MEMQDRSSFENEWEKAFAEAESTPPETIWNKLELDLANSASGMYKRKLTFFKMLAAASIFLAFSIGGIAVYQEYFHLHDHSNPIAESTESAPTDDEIANDNQIDNTKGSNTEEPVAIDQEQVQEIPVIASAKEKFEDNVDEVENTDQRKLTKEQKQREVFTQSGVKGKTVDSLFATNEKFEAENNGNEQELSGSDNVTQEAVVIAKINKNQAAINEANNDGKSVNNNLTAFTKEIIENSTKVTQSNPTTNNSNLDEVALNNNGSDHKNEKTNNEQDLKILNKNIADSDVSNEISKQVALNENQGKIDLKNESFISSTAGKSTNEMLPEKLDGLFEPLEVDNEIAAPDLKMVPRLENAVNRSIKYKRLWAGVGLSRGSFNPNGLGMEENNNAVDVLDSGIPEGPAAPASFNGLQRSSSPSITNETQGSSLNIGVNFGSQISKKWIIQSGISYLEQNTSSSSNAVAIDNVSRGSDPLTEFNDQFSLNNDFVIIGNYGISNSYKSISIPVQAGYILLSSRFNITLLGGISNDFLVSKRIKDDTGNLETVTLGANEVSNINTYNISGIVGSEFGYNLGDNYLISLSPQIRQSFNSFNQGSGSGNGRPFGFEIGFRFKYLLK